MHLHHQRHNQQRHNVDDLDQWVNRWACSVFVRVAYGVASDCSFVRVRAFAAVVTVFNVLLCVIPSAAAGTHRNSDEQAGNDGAHQHATQRFGAQQQANQNRHHHGQQ